MLLLGIMEHLNDSGSQTDKKLRILELFAGIGGLHWALKLADVPCEIVAAMEINPTVMEIYAHNFPEANLLRKNLQGITAKEINDLGVDAIVMSPPCQPFCRMGNRLDVDDNRTGPLSQLTNILKDVNFKYIFVENVQGFETSTARDNLLDVLKKLGFKWQEFMLTPKTVGIPNSRLRYYLIGKHENIQWSFEIKEGALLSEIPNWDNSKAGDQMPYNGMKWKYEEDRKIWRRRWKDRNNDNVNAPDDLPFCVADILEWNLSTDSLNQLKVSNSVLQKYYQAMDIVSPLSTNTCCFTKGYGHYVKGTGSILKMNDNINTITSTDTDCDPTTEEKNQKEILSLRYFSPKEISRLMSYPEQFSFPAQLSLKQKYKSLGNSVNVYVVAILFSLLFSTSAN